MIRFVLACWDLSSLFKYLHYLFKQDALSISLQSRDQTGNILLEANVNPHDENAFGVLIETFGTLNLNISGIYYRRTQCMDEQELPRSECAFLLSHVRHALQK